MSTLIWAGVVAIPPERRGDIWTLFVPCCPLCEGEHVHGGGSGERPYLEGRVPHCPDARMWRRFRRRGARQPLDTTEITTANRRRINTHFLLTENLALNGQPVHQSARADLAALPVVGGVQ